MGLRIDRVAGPPIEDTRPFKNRPKNRSTSCDISKVVQQFITVLRSKPHSPHVQSKGCRELAMLVKIHGFAGVRVILEKEGVAVVVAALRSAIDKLQTIDGTHTWGRELSAEVCNASMMLLGKMAQQQQQIFVQEILRDTLDVIIEALNIHPDSVAVQSAGMYALLAFCLDYQSISQMTAAGVPQIARTVSNVVAFPARSAPHRWAGLLLAKIGEHEDESKFHPKTMQPAVVIRELPAAHMGAGFEPDASPRGIVVAMQQNPNLIKIQAHGCVALAALAKPISHDIDVANYRNAQRVAKAGGIQAVVSALKLHLCCNVQVEPPGCKEASELSQLLAAEACSAMATFAVQEDAYQTTIYELGGMNAAVEAITRYMHVKDVVLQGMRMLAQMARLNASHDSRHDSHLRQRQAAMDRAGVIELTIRTMKNFGSVSRVQEEGCLLLGSLIWRNSGLRTRVAQAGGMYVATAILGSSELQFEALKRGGRLVSRLIHKNAENTFAAFISGVPHALFKALDWTMECYKGMESYHKPIVRFQMYVIDALRDIILAGKTKTADDVVLAQENAGAVHLKRLQAEARRVLLAVLKHHTGQPRADVRFLYENCIETLEQLHSTAPTELSSLADEIKPVVTGVPFLQEYTKMCSHFQAGNCRYGTACRFAHDESQLQWAERSRNKEKFICWEMLNTGACEFGDECRYSHNMDAPRCKTICRYWLGNTCAHGAACNFVHGTPSPVQPCSYRRVDDGTINVDVEAVEKLIAKRVALMDDSCKSAESKLIVTELAAMGVTLDDVRLSWEMGAPYAFVFENWTCEECANLNYDFRIQCNRCTIPKPRFWQSAAAHDDDLDNNEGVYASTFETLDYS
jgi:hypothetical protein